MRELKVQGNGKVSVEPDIVILSFRIESDSVDYSETIRALNERTESLRQNLKDAGIKRAKIKIPHLMLAQIFDTRMGNRFISVTLLPIPLKLKFL